MRPRSYSASRCVVHDRSGGAVTLSGSITNTGAGITVRDNTGGTITFSGSTKSITTGVDAAVTVSNNTGATVSFTNGGLAISSGTGPGFSATGGGTVVVGGSGNTVASTGGTALNVTDTTIGVSGLQFQRISANGGTNGIVLSNTGAMAGLAVSGIQGQNDSGGTIQNTSGHGIALTSTLSPSFNEMVVQSTAGSGVWGTGVVNFSFTNGTISGSNGTDGANIAFNSTGANNVSGVITITNNGLSSAHLHDVQIWNYAGTVSDVNVSSNVFGGSTSDGGFAITFGTFSSANVTRAALNGNEIRNWQGGGIEACGGGSGTFGILNSTTNVISIDGNRIAGTSTSNRMNLHAISAFTTDTATGSFAIANNGTLADPITNVAAHVVSHSALGSSTVTSNVANNVIVANHQSGDFGFAGITGGAAGNTPATDTATMTVTISGNTVSQTDNSGIYFVARDGASTLRIKVLNNTVAAPMFGVRQGIRIDSGNSSSPRATTVCLQISGNVSGGTSTDAKGIGLRRESTVPAGQPHIFGITGMSSTSTPGIETYVNGRNPAGGSTVLIASSSGFSNCSLP